jgi:hypothetical protein
MLHYNNMTFGRAVATQAPAQMCVLADCTPLRVIVLPTSLNRMCGYLPDCVCLAEAQDAAISARALTLPGKDSRLLPAMAPDVQ